MVNYFGLILNEMDQAVWDRVGESIRDIVTHMYYVQTNVACFQFLDDSLILHFLYYI